jgi:hypothetical protein
MRVLVEESTKRAKTYPEVVLFVRQVEVRLALGCFHEIFRKRFCFETKRAWKQWRQPIKMQRTLDKALQVSLNQVARAFYFWKGSTLVTPIPEPAKRLMTRAVLGGCVFTPLVTNLQISRAWWRWTDWVKADAMLSRVTVRFLARHLHLQTYRVAKSLQADALARWAAVVRSMRRKVALSMRFCLERWTSSQCMQAWKQWLAVQESRKRTMALVKRCFGRIIWSGLQASWMIWVRMVDGGKLVQLSDEHATTLVSAEAQLKKLTAKHEAEMRQVSEKGVKALMTRTIARMSRVKLSQAMSKWVAICECYRAMRTYLGRFCNFKCACAFQKWFALCSSIASSDALMRKVVLKMNTVALSARANSMTDRADWLEVGRGFERWCRLAEWSKWRDELEEAREKDGTRGIDGRLRGLGMVVKQLYRCKVRHEEHGIVRAMSRWHRFTCAARLAASEEEHQRALLGLKQQQLGSFMSKFVLHFAKTVQQRSLSQALSQWHQASRALRHTAAVLKCFLGRWVQRACCAAVAQWEGVVRSQLLEEQSHEQQAEILMMVSAHRRSDRLLNSSNSCLYAPFVSCLDLPASAAAERNASAGTSQGAANGSELHRGAAAVETSAALGAAADTCASAWCGRA